MRVRLVIDGDNLLYCQKRLGWAVDYKKLLIWASGFGELQAATFYGAYRESEWDSKKGFYGILRSLKFQLVVRPFKEQRKENGEVYYQSVTDVILARDVVLSLPNTDFYVLVTGDVDFAPLLETFHSLNKEYVLVSTGGHVAYDLQDIAGLRYVDLCELRPTIELDRGC